MDVKTLLMTMSTSIVLVLGLIHMLYTFRGTKLQPRDAALIHAMKAGSLVITKETTVWKAWIGFNASHSMAAILFGLVYGYLASVHPSFFHTSLFLQCVGFLMLAGLLVLARLYWFSVPFLGIAVSLVCYVSSLTIAYL